MKKEIGVISKEERSALSWSHLVTSGLILAGVAAGAGFMFLRDPISGRRRRALIRDKGVRARNLTITYTGKLARDLRNRAFGLGARFRRSHSQRATDDLTIRERIRSELGRKVCHPGAIEVAVVNGEATLCGPVLADEEKDLITTVRRVVGVKRVQNLLEAYHEPGTVPGLQGEGKTNLQDRKAG